MDIASPMKPNVTTQMDYSKRRHQPEKDDLELNPAGQALLAYIEESARPKELAAKSGFELVNVGVEQMDAFMKERIRVYTGVAKQMGLAK